MGEKLKRLRRLEAEATRLRKELYEPHCGVCGRWVNVCCNENAWTCPHHATVCKDCWPAHEQECHP